MLRDHKQTIILAFFTDEPYLNSVYSRSHSYLSEQTFAGLDNVAGLIVGAGLIVVTLWKYGILQVKLE